MLQKMHLYVLLCSFKHSEALTNTEVDQLTRFRVLCAAADVPVYSTCSYAALSIQRRSVRYRLRSKLGRDANWHLQSWGRVGVSVYVRVCVCVCVRA